ncbi:cysteine sulfinic acid decarboxylase-like [Malaya genurostris]|uniref:cysteine sulfinic acid decarboxylase-like n=1 Tax=Malaya genurostris TaxID=325434 RepID=UPI0026F4024A|nr:cysteine sulfinic acid decarboxylase-like [Malaya genurostris]
MEELNLLSKVFDILQSEHVLQPSETEKVFPYKEPLELTDALNLNLENSFALNSAEQEQVLRKIIQHSIKTCHPSYYNEMYAGPDLYGLTASWITDALNACQFTFEAAPVFSLVESAVVNFFLKLCGLEDGEGMFTPGGSIANMYAIAMARHKILPQNKSQGMYGQKPLKIFTSQDSHYSITKSANWLGIGEKNVVKIETDTTSRIDIGLLEKAIQDAIDRGSMPLLVSVTAGTTVFGAFDNLEKVADLCHQYRIWMHVDAAWGGAVVFSAQHRDLLIGIERADSVTLCPQKMLGAPLQCAMILLKHKGLLSNCNTTCAEYLFTADKYYDASYDTGDMSIQCGRKVDSFKLWFMLKARGSAWFGSAVDNAFLCARYFQTKISSSSFFKLVQTTPYQFTNVCFWFIPKRLQLISADEENDGWHAELYKVTLAMKERMVKKGTLMISYSSYPTKKLGYFFRLVLKCVPSPTIAKMDFIIDEMITIGSEL